MSTPYKLSPQQIAVYRTTAQTRHQQAEPEMFHRQKEAWQAAQRAARLLKEQFNASRVVVFGSLARKTGFTRWSDVDIAAWGIAPDDTFRAIGAIMDLDTETPVNLVDVNTTHAALLTAIQQDGVEI